MIEQILQDEVDELTMKKYEKYDRNIEFTVSVLLKDNAKESQLDSHKIILTINHEGFCRSRIIFPKRSGFDYMSIEEEMEYLFNSTV